MKNQNVAVMRLSVNIRLTFTEVLQLESTQLSPG